MLTGPSDEAHLLDGAVLFHPTPLNYARIEAQIRHVMPHAQGLLAVSTARGRWPLTVSKAAAWVPWCSVKIRTAAIS